MTEEPLVQTAAKIFQELVYNYRSSLMAGILVAGWDRRKGGQVWVPITSMICLFFTSSTMSTFYVKVYSIPLGGMCIREKCSIGGSGSSYIYGFVDSNYRENMNKEECIDFAVKGEFRCSKSRA